MSMEHTDAEKARYSEMREMYTQVTTILLCLVTLGALVVAEQEPSGSYMELLSAVFALVAVHGAGVLQVCYYAYARDGWCRRVGRWFTDYDFTIHDIDRP